MSGRPVTTRAELAAYRVESYGRDYSESDDGYGDMEAEAGRGWRPISAWGADGWDLGDWPYVVIYVRRGEVLTVANEADPPGAHRWELMQICEGDRTVYRFASMTDLKAAIDYMFIWYGIGREYPEWEALGITSSFDQARTPGRGSGYLARQALDAGTLRVPDCLRGPYSPGRTTVVAS